MRSGGDGDGVVAGPVSGDGGGRRRRRVVENAGVEKLGEDEAAGGDGGPAVVVIGGRGVEVEAETGGDRRRREVGLGLGTAEGTGGAVVGKGSLLGGIKCAQPNARLLPRVANLGGVASPRSLPNAPVVSLASGRRRRRHETRRRRRGVKGKRSSK